MYKRIVTAAVVVSVFFLSSSSWARGGHHGYHHGHGSEYGIPILAGTLGVVTGALLGSALSRPAPQLAPTYTSRMVAAVALMARRRPGRVTLTFS